MRNALLNVARYSLGVDLKVIIDIETNSLVNPSKIWVIVCKDIDTGDISTFRNVNLDEQEKVRFKEYSKGISQWVGHNWLGYDYPVLNSLLDLVIDDVASCSIDTLIVSKLVDYSRKGHSVEDYGEEFGLDKIKFNNFKEYSKELEDYCIRDVEITNKIYLKYLKYISNPLRKASIELEHKFQLIVNSLHTNGFSFNVKKAKELLDTVEKELSILDKDILK